MSILNLISPGKYDHTFSKYSILYTLYGYHYHPFDGYVASAQHNTNTNTNLHLHLINLTS